MIGLLQLIARYGWILVVRNRTFDSFTVATTTNSLPYGIDLLQNGALSISRQVRYCLEDDLWIDLLYAESNVQLSTSKISATTVPVQVTVYQD